MTALGDDATVPKILIISKMIRVGRGLLMLLLLFIIGTRRMRLESWLLRNIPGQSTRHTRDRESQCSSAEKAKSENERES